jgi:predicted ATPase
MSAFPSSQQVKRLQIRNFKALKSADLHLGQLNLLTGLNSMGKSSLIQALLLLKQSRHSLLSSGTLSLNDGEYVALGKGRDVYYQYAEDPHLSFVLESASGFSAGWNFEYQADRESLAHR